MRRVGGFVTAVPTWVNPQSIHTPTPEQKKGTDTCDTRNLADTPTFSRCSVADGRPRAFGWVSHHHHPGLTLASGTVEPEVWGAGSRQIATIRLLRRKTPGRTLIALEEVVGAVVGRPARAAAEGAGRGVPGQTLARRRLWGRESTEEGAARCCPRLALGGGVD